MNSFLYMCNRNRMDVFINYRCGSRSKCKHNDSKSALLASNKLCISALVKHTELYNIILMCKQFSYTFTAVPSFMHCGVTLDLVLTLETSFHKSL